MKKLFLLLSVIIFFTGCTWKKSGKKIVVLTFDDAVQSHLDVVAPILKEKDFGATFFITAAWMQDTANFLSWDDVTSLHKMGFEIGNHSWTHEALHSKKAISEMEENLAKLDSALLANGIDRPVSFAYPGNHFSPETIKKVQELGFRFARRGMQPEIPYGQIAHGPLYDPGINHPLIIPTTADAYPEWDLDYFKEIIARAEAGKAIVLQFHGVPDIAHPWVHTDPQKFRLFMDYLEQQDVRVIAMKDLDKYFRIKETDDPALKYSYGIPASVPELTDEFLVYAYSGPPPAELNAERFSEIAESGIEILCPANGVYSVEQNLKLMDLAHDVGIRIIPADMRPLGLSYEPDMPVDTLMIKNLVDDYKHHPAMAAYLIKDEPGGDKFTALKNVSQLVSQLDHEHLPLINLFPSYASNEQLKAEGFRDYLTSYIKVVKPRLISWDNYALRLDATSYEPWFNDLQVVREESRKADLPYVVFIQSEGIKEGLRVPNREEILWQVNTALAYGVSGIGWFCYWTPLPAPGEGIQPGLVETHHNAMIDLKGEKTEIYDYVKEANFYAREIGKELRVWDNYAVARYESGEMKGEGSSPILVPQGTEANVVVGAFKKGKRYILYISNSRCDSPARFKADLKPPFRIKGVKQHINSELPKNPKKNREEWILEAGGSVILEIEEK